MPANRMRRKGFQAINRVNLGANPPGLLGYKTLGVSTGKAERQRWPSRGPPSCQLWPGCKPTQGGVMYGGW